MAKTVTIDKLGSALDDAIKMLSEGKEKQVEKAVRASFIDTCQEIIIKTPVNTGRARSNWFLSQGKPSGKVTESRNFDNRINEVRNKFSGKVFGNSFYLTNNLPYIKTLEYGGYPKNPQKGTRVRKGAGYEIRSRGGFSKQAPSGMVRITVNKFSRRFKKNLKVFS